MPTSVPSRNPPPPTWPHHTLWERVSEAIKAIPAYFRTTTVLEGILGPDIFTLNTLLGATIEEQIVRTLNGLRPVWDPDRKHQTYAFVRQPQRFPDVVLRRSGSSTDIILGIELKGWCLVAKEGEPSLRFLATPAVCGPQDLIVVVPWALSNVISGSPVAYTPFVELARYCAEQRNYYWEHQRKTAGSTGITLATHAAPYPKKSDPISDRPLADPGGNFGRIARYGIMDTYVKETMETPLAGIPASAWLKFFKAHARDVPEASIDSSSPG